MLSHALRAKVQNGTLPVATDPNFKQVSLLLHGDGTNGAQNNTFLDSSTNNFTVTRNGNTTQGTNTPFSQAAGYWSNNTTSGTFTVPNNTAFDFGSGDFTIEFWAYLNASIPSGTLAKGTSFMPFGIYFGGAELAFYSSSNGTSWDIASNRQFVSPVPSDVWNHYAVTRSGTTFRTFYNGVVTNTWTSSATLVTNSSAVSIGNFGSGNNWQGYLSNVRLVKGTAVYTAAFTPPTTPLTAITNTSLLTCQSNNFKDNSSNNFTITRTGTPSIQPFSPFAPTAAYSTSVNGGSMYFDGTGDYLTVATNAAFTYGVSDFTMECWVYLTTTGAIQYIIDQRNSGTANAVIPALYVSASNVLTYFVSNAAQITGTTALTANAWYHVAVSRSTLSTKMFLNGVQEGSTYTDANSYVASRVVVASNAATIGNHLTGYTFDVRLVNGTALYTTTFTPPTAPLTAITNTSLLLSGTNAGIFDNASKNNLETVGNAQVSTSVVKYGTGSMSFDGTGDYLTIPSTPQLQFGTGNYTIEGWIYLNSVAATNKTLIGTGSTSATTNWQLSVDPSYPRFFYSGNSVINGLSAPSLNTWYHLAATRSGTTVYFFVDGVLQGTATDSSNLTDSNAKIGLNRGSNSYLNGYIDDLRITKGVARYTANFTPPTAAFPNQ